MATTIIPNIDEPLDPNLDVAVLYETVKEWLLSAQGDSDKGDEVEAVCYYDGIVSGTHGILNLMQGHNPDYPETSDQEYERDRQEAIAKGVG